MIQIDGNLRRQFEARAAGQGAVVLSSSTSSRPMPTRFDAFVRKQRAGRAARARADAARPHHVGERHQGRRHQGAAERRLGAAKRPRHHLRGRACRAARAWSRANGGTPDYQGPPLVSFEKKIADGLNLKVGDPVVGQRARPQHRGAHRQPARGRLGEPRHQFRAGVLAQRLRRRAAHRHRHADLSGRRHASRRKPRCSRR